MKVSLDLHDFSVVNNNLDVLFHLKCAVPELKVSLFTVPIDTKADFGQYLVRERLLRRVKGCLDWIQIIPHGLYHTGREMSKVTYKEFNEYYLPMIQKAFNDDGLPFVKGFLAPHWKWNEEVVRALDDAGWWGAIDPRQYMPKPKRFYQYNCSIDEKLPEKEILKLHGHLFGTKNDLVECYENILKVPASAEWHYVTDFIEKKDWRVKP